MFKTVKIFQKKSFFQVVQFLAIERFSRRRGLDCWRDLTEHARLEARRARLSQGLLPVLIVRG
jgi:hypothetical protein